MDLVVALLKNLYSQLSPVQFLTVLALLVVFGFFVAKVVLALSKKKSLSRIFNSDATDLEALNAKIDVLSASITVLIEAQLENTQRILDKFIVLKDDVRDQYEMQKNIVNDLQHIKHITTDLGEIENRLSEMKHQIELMLSNNILNNGYLKENIVRVLATVLTLLNQLNHINEYTKTSIPEFKSLHKDLDKNLQELRLEITLIERSMRAYTINSSSSVNLR